MAFGGEMHDGIHLVLVQQAVYQFPVADVALHKSMMICGREVSQIVQAAGVRQSIQVDNMNARCRL
ncbi:hypothetical protein GCM10009097_59220 [Pigmentiphaga daeguensis]|uniref:Uncharacterized protein n=1 Tax=Pigmentiphaga daeguensis TaxID=414049 RepID=A0ABP3N6K2_9BURK